MLTKNGIAIEIEELTGVRPNLVKRVLDALADVAESEVADGQDFSVPGICKVAYTYRKPQKKGERWKKGEERVKFGGVTEVAESDSPPVTAMIKLKASPTGKVGRLKPGSKPEVQRDFLKTKAAKAVVRRKS